MNSKESQSGIQLLTQNEEVRIVLVGKTGAGKSATGNTILGKNAFLAKLSSLSLTKNCDKRREKVGDRSVAVIDTPGLFDTSLSNEDSLKKIAKCISFSAPGPHVFLIVIRLGRFTEEEQKTVAIIQRFFGDEASKYTMVLFTYGEILDDLEMEDFVLENPDLKTLISQCNGGYHVFGNKAKNSNQVPELLQKINKMVMRNGGSHYTTEMFQKAERAIEEEKNRILREDEEKIRGEEEKLKKEKMYQEDLEKALKEENERILRENEELKCRYEEELKKMELEVQEEAIKEENERVLKEKEEKKRRHEEELKKNEQEAREEAIKEENERIQREKEEQRLRENELKKMKQEAREKAIKEENERIQREIEKQRLREEELEKLKLEKEAKDKEIKEVREKHEREARKRAEGANGFIDFFNRFGDVVETAVTTVVEAVKGVCSIQ